MNDNQTLALRNNAKKQLLQIKNIETGIAYLNKVKAIEVWVKAEKKDAELQNIVAEQKIRTQRILGGLIKAGQEKGEIRTQQVNASKTSTSKGLDSLGITRKESSTFKAISEIPDEVFEKEIANKKETVTKAVSELTTAGMLMVSKKIKHEARKKEFEKNTPEKTTSKINIFKTDKKFRIIYADPAWSYNDKQDTSQLGGAKKHYGTMSIKEISNLPVNTITEKNAVLFLWVTSPLLEECFEVIKAWGFKYKTSFVWDKIKHNMGHYNSVRHEFLLVCTKGNCVPDNKKLYDSVISIERNSNHSEKPIEFMNIIDDIYTYGNKLEMFARKERKKNWFMWGNEI